MRQPLHETTKMWVPLMLAASMLFSSGPLTSVEAANAASIEHYPLHSQRASASAESAAAAAQWRRREQEKYSNEEKEQFPPTQLKIHSFTLVLSPTPAEVPSVEATLHGVIETTIQSYIQTQTDELDYVYLADILEVSRSDEDDEDSDGGSGRTRTRRSLQDEVATTIVFTGGVASFEGHTEEHDPLEVNFWVKEAVEQALPAMFSGPFSQQYGTISTVTYISSTEAPTMAPTLAPVVPVIGGAVGANGSLVDDTKGTRYGVILSAAMGAVLFLVAAVLLVRMHRQHNVTRRHPLEKEASLQIDDAATEVDDAESNHGDATSDITEVESEVAQYRHRGDITGINASGGGGGRGGSTTGSMAGSSIGGLSAPEEMADAVSVTSDWTLSTLDGSMIAADRQRINNSWVATENFDRDRQVNISKDMLHTAWSGPQPSTAATPAVPRPTASSRSSRGDFSSWRTEQGDSPAFVFEQANGGGGGGEGEEVFLMPPARETSNMEARRISDDQSL